MLKIDVDIGDSAKIVERMLVHIDYVSRFGLRKTLMEWQDTDLHRKQPFLTGSKRARRRAVTKVRPHSKFEMAKAHKNIVRAKRRHRPSPHTSTRPILRSHLFGLLGERMRALAEIIKWDR